MPTSTTKITTEVDYLVYLNKHLRVLGFELSEDDRTAFQLRYRTPEGCGINGKIPGNTEYTLEVYDVPSVLAFTIEEEKGDLLFYRPYTLAFAKEIVKVLTKAQPFPPPDKTKEETKKIVGQIPEMPETQINAILERVPYPNWMEECWRTKAWIAIWKNKPSLHAVMLEFLKTKYLEQEKTNE